MLTSNLNAMPGAPPWTTLRVAHTRLDNGSAVAHSAHRPYGDESFFFSLVNGLPLRGRGGQVVLGRPGRLIAASFLAAS
jgi:hypothetical protein